jgi:pheromone a factor receptor
MILRKSCFYCFLVLILLFTQTILYKATDSILLKMSDALLPFTIPLRRISSYTCGQLPWVAFHLFILVRLLHYWMNFREPERHNIALTLRAFWKRRMQFSELLSSSASINFSRYIRLMLLACMEMTCTIPIATLSMYKGTRGVALEPWISWEDTHYNFSRVVLIPAVIWRSDPSARTAIELTRWLYPTCALLFFALFGFASEAQNSYRRVFWKIAGLFGLKPSTNTSTKQSLPTSSWYAFLPDLEFSSSELSILVRWKTSSKSKSFAAISSPPPYSSSKTKDSPGSLVSTFAGSEHGTDIDLEKATDLPFRPYSVIDISPKNNISQQSSASSAVTTPESPALPDDQATDASDVATLGQDVETESCPHISVTDVYSPYYSTASRSPSPISVKEENPIPLWHRPFSPPSVYPAVSEHPSSRRVEAGTTIQVIIHKESATSF